MNNKGFAISTMLYGLSIVGLLIAVALLQTLSSTRSEERQLVTSVEDELNTFSATSKFFGKSGTNMANYIIPNYETGWYKIELWGSKSSAGVQGSYSTATLYIQRNTPLYFYLGNKTSPTTYLCMKSNKVNCTKSTAGTYVMNSEAKFTALTPSETSPFPNGNVFNTAGKNFRTETIYHLTKINNDEFGKARVTLVSKKYDNDTDSKRYVPIKNASASSGTYYIIDRTDGKALTYKEGSFPQVTFENFDGNGNQKWLYNKINHSLISNRKHCALRHGEEKRLFCDAPYVEDNSNNNFVINPSITDGATVNANIQTNNTSQVTTFTIISDSYFLSKDNNDGVVNTNGKNFYILNAN